MSIQARFHVTHPGFRLDAEFEAPSQGITGIFGESGAGKTTLLRAIAGLDRYASGHLKINDTVWQDGQRFIPTHRRRVGYVFQEPSLFTHRNVQGNLDYALARGMRNGAAVPLDPLIELLELRELLTRFPHQLSGGEQQRVAIARALAAQPALLLMDEPLASLDRRRRSEILPYLEALHADTRVPMIYVSHALDEIARLADHLLLLDNGRIVASGDVATLMTRLDLPLAVYDRAEALIEAKVVSHDREYQLTELEFSGGRLFAPQSTAAIGSTVRVRVLAKDVSVTMSSHADTSILNILAAHIVELAPAGDASVIVKLCCGDAHLLARITQKSVDNLALEPGKAVFVQAKSVALLG